MNTEFPTRIPSVTTTSTSTANSTKAFQDTVVKVLNAANNNLEKFVDKAGELVKSTKRKSKDDSTKNSDSKKEAVNSVVLQTAATSSVGYLKKLADTISKFFNRPKSSEDKEDEKDGKEVKQSLDSIKQSLKDYSKAWTKQITNLQSIVTSMSNSLMNTISNVFGGGLFGQVVGRVISKSLEFVVNKVLIGTLFANIPRLLLTGAIAYGLYKIADLLVKYGEDIWDAIKYVGYAIDQGVDAVISNLPWSKGDSKYENARKELAEAAGVSEKEILTQYGDTVRGRNQAYEDWKKAQEDPAFKKELIANIKKGFEDFGMHTSQTTDSLQYTKNDPTTTLLNTLLKQTQPLMTPISGFEPGQSNYDFMDSLYGKEDGELKEEELSDEFPYYKENNNLNYSPVVNTTNNNSMFEMSTFNNVSEALPQYSTMDAVGILNNLTGGLFK